MALNVECLNVDKQGMVMYVTCCISTLKQFPHKIPYNVIKCKIQLIEKERVEFV